MTTSKHQEELLDEALTETFPASDPPRPFLPVPPPDGQRPQRSAEKSGQSEQALPSLHQAKDGEEEADGEQ